MRLMTLDEAKTYLEQRNIRRNIWELKQDIKAGKLNYRKIGERHWLNENDLNNAYTIQQLKINALDYQRLRSEGLSKEEIIQSHLIPIYKDETRARRAAKGFELQIARKIYSKKIEQEIDIKKSFDKLEERTRLLREYSEKHALGLVDEMEKIESEMKEKETIWCRISEVYDNGLTIQLPVTSESQTEGLYASLDLFFRSKTFLETLDTRGIKLVLTRQGDYIALAFYGKQQQIINTIKEHLSATQPEGFAKANLEAKLFIPARYDKKEEDIGRVAIAEDEKKVSQGRLYSAEEIDNMFGIRGPQKRAWLTMKHKVEPVIVNGGKRVYKILISPRD